MNRAPSTGAPTHRARKIEQGGPAPAAEADRKAARSGAEKDAKATDTAAFCTAARGKRGDDRKGPDSRARSSRSNFAALRVSPLSHPRSATSTQPLAVNDADVVVGRRGGDTAGRLDHGFVARPPFRAGDIKDADVRGARQTRVAGINRAGVQVGSFVSRDGATSGFVRLDDAFRTVRHPRSKARPTVDRLLGVNGRGVAAGFYNDERGKSHAYLFDTCSGACRPVRLPVRAESVQATAINDAGTVIGVFTQGRVTRGFVLDRGRFTAIKLGNDTATRPTGIDGAGDVVGSFVDKRGRRHGFVMARGRTHTVDVPHARSTVVTGLNDRGRLVGFFTSKDGRTVGFVATAAR